MDTKLLYYLPNSSRKEILSSDNSCTAEYDLDKTTNSTIQIWTTLTILRPPSCRLTSWNFLAFLKKKKYISISLKTFVEMMGSGRTICWSNQLQRCCIFSDFKEVFVFFQMRWLHVVAGEHCFEEHCLLSRAVFGAAFIDYDDRLPD